MTRHEFEWRAVLGVLGGADLSRNCGGRSLWPSEKYREGYEQLLSRLVAPPRPLTIDDLERVIDKLFTELAQVEPSNAAVAERLEKAAVSLREAKRQAHVTRRKPSIFDEER